MGVLGSKQVGKDGVGKAKILNGITAVRLKAKSVTAAKNTTLKITGNLSGATYTMDIVTQPGESSPGFDPPPVENNPAPISSFVHELRSVGNGQGQETSPQVPDSNSNLAVQSIYNEVPNVQERTQGNRGTNDDGNVR